MRNRSPIGGIATCWLLAAIVAAGCGGGSGGGSGTGGTTGTGGGAQATGGDTGRGGGASGGTAGQGGSGGTGTGGGASATGGQGGHGGAAGRASGGTTGSGGQAGGQGGVAGSGAGGSSGQGGSSGAGGHAATTLRIMPLGDSTTASICYRSHLWQLLTQAGDTNFDFIGTRHGDPGCSFTAYDQDNEGHGGYIVSDVLKAAGTGVRPSGADSTDPYLSDARDLTTWFSGHPADIVLMHFGTNDVWNGIPASTILQAYSAILTSLRAANPNVHLMIAQITPLDPSGCTTCTSGVTTLNSMIPGWATSNTTAASPITVVDQYTGFDDTADTRDGVHANDGGSLKIATNWFNALKTFF